MTLKPNSKKRRFCSTRCYSQFAQIKRSRAKRELKNHTCNHCGINMVDMKNKKKYCSDGCQERDYYTKRRSQEIAKRYKISKDQYEQKLIVQKNRCAICRKEDILISTKKVRSLAVDHCHETKEVRGLLCSKCNLGIGLFNDSWLLLDNAIEYLTYWHSKHGSSKVQSVQESPVLN